MKKIIILVALFFATFNSLQAQVAINTTGASPNNFSMLDVSGTQKGVLIPRISTSDRNTMAGSMGTLEEGLTVYDTDTKSFWFWNGSAWVAVGNGAITEDKDWYKEGTTDSPTDISDKMFHLGDVAIGKNTADAPLDLYSSTAGTLMNLKLDNSSSSSIVKVGAKIDVDGVPINTTGKEGAYITVGGDPGSGELYGLEVAVNGEDGVDQPEYGMYIHVDGNNAGGHVGYSTFLDGNGDGYRYAIYNTVGGNSNNLNALYYGVISNSGDGIHFGNFYKLYGSGNGVQYANFNRIANSGSGKQIGVVNEIKNAGTSVHVGTFNSLGAGVHEDNPTNLAPISNDSDGKRVGSINVVAGDGGGIHIGENNSIISTGDGMHIGSSNVLGYDYINSQNTSTNGLHFGQINNLADTGNRMRVGNLNLLGATIDPANPSNIIAVTSDSDAKRVGEVNVIAGDGGGLHVAESNTIISTGNGLHIGVSNVLGYDYKNHTNTSTDGSQTAVLNNITDTGAGDHIGTSNVLGLIIDPTNPNNYIAVTGDSNAKRIGEVNILGGDGTGDFVGISNSIINTGNGSHIASYNKVAPGGTGSHIAVYGEVDTNNDPGALAGAFKGYTTATNQVSTINLFSGKVTNFDDTSGWKRIQAAEAGFDPTIYNKLGVVEVKVVIRVVERNGADYKFRLKSKNSSGSPTLISDTDTWTWTETTSGKYIVTSEWKPWLAGTSIWEVFLQAKTDANMKIDNVYIVVRPAQVP